MTSTMQRAAITGREEAEIFTVPIPEPVPGWALVKVVAAPMCTEYKRWRDGSTADGLGHEAVGEVVAAPECHRVRVGDRVVVHPLFACGRCTTCENGDYIYCEHQLDGGCGDEDGTMAGFVSKPEWLLTQIPDDLTYRQASLAGCALGPTFGAMERLGVGATSVVLITGLGPVGLGGVVNARFRGARCLAVESNAWRQQKALELGAEVVLDPRDHGIASTILEATQGRGVDFAVDCSGAPAAHRLAIDVVRRRGGVALVGESSQDTTLQASRDMIEKGLTLIGNWHYPRSYYPKVIEVARRADADGLISHTFPLADVQDALATIAGQETAKVILEPWN